MRRPPFSRRATTGAVILLALPLGLTACSSGPATIGAATASTFALRRFDQLPKPTRTHAIGLRSDMDGVTVRSYASRNRTAEDVIAFYDRMLPREGWTPVPPPSEAGSPHQTTFRSGTYLLRVTAEEAPTLGLDGPVVQFSLEVTRPSVTS